MIKVYVMNTCPDCTDVKRAAKNDDHLQLIDIGEHVRNLKEFLQLRDNRPEFDEIKEKGGVGIPCYVHEDGSITLSSAEVGLDPISDGLIDGVSCGLDGKGC